MALDSKDQRTAPGAGQHRLEALRAALAAVVPDADASDIHAASEHMDEVLSGEVPAPGWDRALFGGWQDTRDGVRLAKRAIRVALHQHHLPTTGEVFEIAYDVARNAY